MSEATENESSVVRVEVRADKMCWSIFWSVALVVFGFPFCPIFGVCYVYIIPLAVFTGSRDLWILCDHLYMGMNLTRFFAERIMEGTPLNQVTRHHFSSIWLEI